MAKRKPFEETKFIVLRRVEGSEFVSVSGEGSDEFFERKHADARMKELRAAEKGHGKLKPQDRSTYRVIEAVTREV